MSENILKVENATMQFGGVVAVDNLNLEINQGEIVALIGPNGAGKTTAFNVVTGVYQPMMALMTKAVTRTPPKDAGERAMQDAFLHGGDWVSEQALTPVLERLAER